MQQMRWILGAAILCSAPAWAATPVSRPIGIDLKGIDHDVKPGDNFFRYANGDWLKTAQIPADRSSTGSFYKMFEQSEKNTAELIRNAGASHPAAGSNARKIADYYAAWMDTATIEKRGLAAIKPELAQVEAIASREDLARVLGSRLRADVDPINATNYHTQNLFGLFVTQGLEDPSHNIAYLLQGGLGLPSRDYYLSNDPHMVEARGKYLSYVAALLQQAGVDDAQAKATGIVVLETKIANAQASLIDSENIHKANNLWSPADFGSKAPGLDWPVYFKAAGLQSQSQIDAWQPGAITSLSALTASEPLQAWKDLLAFHTINQAADLLPKAYADLSFDFYVRTLQGTPMEQPRWKRAVGATNAQLGDAVGQLYVKNYFPASSKAEIEQLVKNLIAAFHDRIDTLSWMTPATRAKAKDKLDTLRVGVGYPDTWRDYSSLEIRANDALGNSLRAKKFEFEHQRAKLGQPVDKGEWWMTPQTVNAVNLPLQNALNFPAAILQPPFFDPKSDAAANYGSIGAIIGHEISHSFDNLGAEFDAQGKLDNWWTPEDLAHFQAAGQQLVAQFNQYEALPGLHVNGEQTLGENIADVSGLTIAYLAYQKSLDGKPAPVIDGLTGDQRFFIAFGQSWRGKIRDAALRQRLATDVHAPGDFRAETVRNLDQWYPAFKVKPSEKLYLAPQDRVKIW
ncbi:M13 family metallopeptidase [Rhodanobacter sp. AS-Z3]|uniref:M13 family metallopeptidase n=1 Tax=Rhodanobacter sp. AS-Z3 TaxID=3031330 RepID=UPI0024788EC4|nr:M13 family metallopeptidase [Rhodanobacter sp. AS-Z3]WEN14749.1 M13 family metallopeptidase [Rhodanobacter sp. AS-Z3]